MSTLFISLLTLVLIIISVFVVLIVLMQRTSQSGGMGAALGGGAAESAFGAETTNVLTKGTIYGTIAYFVIALGLYLIYQSRATGPEDVVDTKSLISLDEEEAGAETNTMVVDQETLDSINEDIAGTIEAEVESEVVNEGLELLKTVPEAAADTPSLPETN